MPQAIILIFPMNSVTVFIEGEKVNWWIVMKLYVDDFTNM